MRLRRASPARPASAAWRIECAISPLRSRPIRGRNSRRGSQPLSGAFAGDRASIGGRYPRRLRQRFAERARLFRRRFRSLHCAPAIAGHASPICTDNKPPRTAVRRGTAKAQDHAQRLRREAGAQAHVRRAHPSRGALARPTLYRVRAPPDRPVRKELNDEYQVSTTPLETSTQPRVLVSLTRERAELPVHYTTLEDYRL